MSRGRLTTQQERDARLIADEYVASHPCEVAIHGTPCGEPATAYEIPVLDPDRAGWRCERHKGLMSLAIGRQGA